MKAPDFTNPARPAPTLSGLWNGASIESLSKRGHRSRAQRGAALLLVLACLLLITTLIVGLLLNSQYNLKSSKLYADGSSVKTLADSTISLVMAQIQQATSNGTTVAWASQPGMIRTYDNTGMPLVDYRLFSWDSPTWNVAEQGAPYNPATDEAPLSTSGASAWYNSPAVFVDLNQPINDLSGTPHFPIIDGSDSDLSSVAVPAPGGATATVKTYVNPATTSPAVEGFWINQTGGPAVTTEASVLNDIPMPVKWLYVLSDGTVAAPSGTGTQITIAGASAANPITGRIAYWTDDETSKININTASEGNYWDTPHAQGITDFNMATFQPLSNEYQRYPGHPAMTCLSSVLGSFLPLPAVDHTLNPNNSGAPYNNGASAAAVYGPYQAYYDLAPKLNIDTPGNLGSQAGTVTAFPGPALTSKNDRLFASVDELMFKSNLFADSDHSTAFPSGGRSATSTALTAAMLEKTKFFLTASSRAPDVNLFNQPRVVAWPVSATNSAAYRTTLDQTIAFCGTIDQFPYYFQRARSDHPTDDLPAAAAPTGVGRNRSLMQYLQYLTSQPIPGFGPATFYDKYPVVTTGTGAVSERDQILTEIFDYIRCLNLYDQSSPATMTNPFTTTGLNSGQVIPIYDTVTKTKGFGRFPTIQEISLVFIATGWNDGKGGTNTNDVNYQNPALCPTTFTPSTGSPAPWGYYNADAITPGSDGMPHPLTNPPNRQPAVSAYVNAADGMPYPAIPSGNIQVQAALVISYFDPSQGNSLETNAFKVQITGLDAWKWGATAGTATMGFPGSGSDTSSPVKNISTGTTQFTTQTGGNLGFRQFICGFFPYAATAIADATVANNYYPFFSTPQNFPYITTATRANGQSPGTFYFSGGQITLNILPALASTTSAGWPPSSWPLTNSEGGLPPLQSLTVTFPPATLPLPTYAPPGYGALSPLGSSGPLNEDRGLFLNRFNASINNYSSSCEFSWGIDNGTQVTLGDTIRSIRASPGDIRMIAALPSVNTSTASSSPGYFDDGTQLASTGSDPIFNAGLTAWTYSSPTSHMVDSLRESTDFPFYGSVLGQLVPSPVAYSLPTATRAPGGALLNFSYMYTYGFANFSGEGGNAGAMGAFIGGGTTGSPGDWDNGSGISADGSFINKADEGDYNLQGIGGVPYFGDVTYSNTNSAFQTNAKTLFSPNRLMPGPGNVWVSFHGRCGKHPLENPALLPKPGCRPQPSWIWKGIVGHVGSQRSPSLPGRPIHRRTRTS